MYMYIYMVKVHSTILDLPVKLFALIHTGDVDIGMLRRFVTTSKVGSTSHASLTAMRSMDGPAPTRIGARGSRCTRRRWLSPSALPKASSTC